MNSIQVLGNLTIVSVFQLIFVQQNYRTINFFSKGLQNDVLDQVIRIASDSMMPFEHLNIDKIWMKRTSYDSPILNIVDVNDLDDYDCDDNEGPCENHLYGTTVLWSTSSDDLNKNLNQFFKQSSKVITITNSTLFAVNNFVETESNEINLNNFSFSLTNQFLTKFFSIESIKGSNLTIFMLFNAPKSELTHIDDNYLMIGPDGIVAESLVKHLNFKPKFSSNVAVSSPNYQEWLHSSILSLRLRYQNYHPRILTNNVVTNFTHS